MAQISLHYQIPRPVPFLDVDVNGDNRLFIDPHTIRMLGAPQPFAADANRDLKSFFDEVTRCALSALRRDRDHGLDLLQAFTEPWETRLGLSKAGFYGHGGAEMVGATIWESLTTDPEALLQIGMLQWLENLPLFAEGVDRDITSDITTRVVFQPLADFTAAMVARFPQFTSGGRTVETVSRQVWDGSTLEWTEAKVDLPIIDGKALLLVPRDWARRSLMVSAKRFYDTTVLDYAQLEQAVRAKNGQLTKTRKSLLRKQAALTPGRDTILKVTRRALDRDEDLLKYYLDFVDERYEPLTDEDITRRVS